MDSSGGSLSGSLVEQLSGKPIELGPCSIQGLGISVGEGMQLSNTELVPGPRGGDSAGPKGWWSWWGLALVIPHGARAWQGLRCGGIEGQDSGRVWIQLRPGVWCSWGGAWIWHGLGHDMAWGAGITVGCESSLGLGSGARGAEPQWCMYLACPKIHIP
jgi:hypothetical protein